MVRRILRRRDEAGATAVIVALFFSFIALPIGAVSVDLARMYVELQRVQAAADAAATAGVTFMPDDFASAKARAIEIAADNGFPNSGTSAVTVGMGNKPTQLRVTVSSTVQNAFARSFGMPTSTLTRTALADFNGPAPMGSPCNTFANEPEASTSVAGYGPAGKQMKEPSPATCGNPQFWGAITGPETVKDQGSEFDARKCDGGEDGCASLSNGAKNNEFDPRGFIYLVRVAASGINQPIRMQIYDPAYVETASDCSIGPVSLDPDVGGNTIASTDRSKYPYATGDAENRYDNVNDSDNFCSGDSDNAGKRFGNEVPTITSFAMRSPVDNLNPYSAPALNPTQCTKQWPGYSFDYVTPRRGSPYWASGPTSSTLRNSGNLTGQPYDANVAKVFHQWVDLCTFTPTQAGDYYLQVRNNVALPGSYTLDATGAVAGNSQVIDQTGDDPSVLGNGTNQFAIRAVTGAPAGGVSVSPWEKMRIYANADSANTTFNLVRVVPAAANKTLVVTYFDVGEATGSSSGTVEFLPPVDAKRGPQLGPWTPMTTLTGCTASGPTNSTNLAGCKVTGITSTTNNGKLQTVRIPIPNDYTCTVTSSGGCWFKVSVTFPGSQVHDATTWTARIVGEPVRLIE